MSARFMVVSAIWTMLSVVGMIWWMLSLLAGNGSWWEDLGRDVELLVDSKIAIVLLVNLAVNVYILLALAIKAIFFKQIYPSECRKVLEQHVDYVLYKALTVHGFHLIEIWLRHSIDNESYCLASLDFYKSIEAAGSLEEWKGLLNRNCGFLLDFIALLMSVGHYLMIWWLQGMAFHLANAVIFLYLYYSLIEMVKRVRGFIKLNDASISLGEELPDATNKELSAYDDQCAICRGQMTKAKKLPCNHLFHLACLKSWLDQCWTEVYSCPTCRALLFVSSSQNQMNSFARQISNDVHIAESIELVLHHQIIPGHSPPAVVPLQPSTEPF